MADEATREAPPGYGAGMQAVLSEPANVPVVRKFVTATAVMLTAPFLVFVLLRTHVLPLVAPQLDANMTTVYAGAGAVVTCNVVIMVYAWLAWMEDDERVAKRD